MNSDRYIPSRINWDIDAANFWVKNHTVKEKYHDYLLSTRLPEQVCIIIFSRKNSKISCVEHFSAE